MCPGVSCKIAEWSTELAFSKQQGKGQFLAPMPPGSHGKGAKHCIPAGTAMLEGILGYTWYSLQQPSLQCHEAGRSTTGPLMISYKILVGETTSGAHVASSRIHQNTSIFSSSTGCSGYWLGLVRFGHITQSHVSKFNKINTVLDWCSILFLEQQMVRWSEE